YEHVGVHSMNGTRETGWPSARYQADSRLVVRRVGAETLLVPVSSGVGGLDSIYTLSEVGSRVWAMLAQPVSVADIVGPVCTEYEVEPDQARHDIVDFLNLLDAKKLVQCHTGRVTWRR